MKFGDLIWVHYIYHWAGCSSHAYTVREESMLVPQNLCVWNLKLPMLVPVWGGWRLGCQQGCELSNTEWWLGPSHDDPLEVPSQSAPALPKNTTGTAVYCLGCHHCAVPYHTWLFKDGSFLGGWRKLCWRKAQAWACGYHDVFLWRDTPVYM